MPRRDYYRKPLFNFGVVDENGNYLGDVLASDPTAALEKGKANYPGAAAVERRKLPSNPAHVVIYEDTDPEVRAALEAKQAQPLKN